MGVDETPDGNLRLQVALAESLAIWWDWTPGDSLKLTLVMGPETFAIAEYMWKVLGDPAKHPGSFLVYKEEAPVGRLAVEIPVDASIRNELAASPEPRH